MSRKSYTNRLQTVEDKLTSAQIKALFTTPAVLIPAPGVGFYIEVVKLTLIMRFGTVAYTVVGVTDVDVAYDPAVSIADVDAIINVAASQIRIENPTNVNDTLANIANKAIKLVAAGANPAAGDGELEYKISYYVRPTTSDLD
jgi:hypothetical protein